MRLRVECHEAAYHGLAPGDVSRFLQTADKGRTVSTALEGEMSFSHVVWYDAASRSDPAVIGQSVLDTPSHSEVAVSQVAELLDATGPNTLGHGNVQRRIVVSGNVQHHSRGDVLADVRTAVRAVTEKLRAEDGGKFRVRQEASTRLLAFGAAVVGVSLLPTRSLSS